MGQVFRMNDTGNAEGAGRIAEAASGVSATVVGDHRNAPHWIELLPSGVFAGRDGRGPFRLLNPTAVIEATDALRMDAGLPIDYDHATDFAAPAGRPAPAAGWIQRIEARDGALWGEVEWTSHGAAAVVTREYRYISPVFEFSEDGEVTRILRAALTNNPNLYLTAISAQFHSGGAGSGSLRDPATEFENVREGTSERMEMSDLAEHIRELVGLGTEATAAEILDTVRNVLSECDASGSGGSHSEAATINDGGNDAAVGDPARYVAVAQYESALTELNQLRMARARERAGYTVDAAMKAGKIVPAQREWAIAYCQANSRGFEDFVARQPAIVTGAGGDFNGAPGGVRVGSSGREEGYGGQPEIALTRTELSICARLGLRPQDYIKRRSVYGELSTDVIE
jgi:phage I-like protein